MSKKTLTQKEGRILIELVETYFPKKLESQFMIIVDQVEPDNVKALRLLLESDFEKERLARDVFTKYNEILSSEKSSNKFEMMRKAGLSLSNFGKNRNLYYDN